MLLNIFFFTFSNIAIYCWLPWHVHQWAGFSSILWYPISCSCDYSRFFFTSLNRNLYCLKPLSRSKKFKTILIRRSVSHFILQVCESIFSLTEWVKKVLIVYNGLVFLKDLNFLFWRYCESFYQKDEFQVCFAVGKLGTRV